MPEFLSLKQVADYLHTSLTTCRGMVRRREIPTIRVGRQHRILKSDLEKWIAAGGSPQLSGSKPGPKTKAAQ